MLDREGECILQAFGVCVLFVVLILACGAPSPTPEEPPTQVGPPLPTASPLATQAQAIANPTPHIHLSTPTSTGQEVSPLPTTSSADQEASPLPTPTSTSQEVSPIPTPTEPPSPTLTVGTGVETIPTYTYRIVEVFPHDPAAYIQGLVFADGVFFEGTGLHEQSTLRRVDPQTGAILQLHVLPPDLYGEGITIWKDRIIQLTWKERVGLVYDKASFELLDTFHYPTEGWGITHDGTKLIMSDGTSMLHFWDPETFEEVGWVEVTDQAGPVTWLNELEYVEGLVYANVWQTDLIAMIEPDTGQVTGWIDLTGLLSPEELQSTPGRVLNGIAYSEQDRRLFVTGKRWPRLFEIELVPLPSDG